MQSSCWYGLYVWNSENGRELGNSKLITFYYDEFIQTLKLLGYSESPPTLLDLNLKLLEDGKLNVVLSICFIPFGFIDYRTTNVEDLFAAHTEKNKQIRKKLLEHPVCKFLVQKELRSWWHKGWLDVWRETIRVFHEWDIIWNYLNSHVQQKIVSENKSC